MKTGEIWKNKQIDVWAKIIRMTTDSMTLHHLPKEKGESLEEFMENIKVEEFKEDECVVYKHIKVGDGSTNEIPTGSGKFTVKVDGEEITCPCSHFYKFWEKISDWGEG